MTRRSYGARLFGKENTLAIALTETSPLAILLKRRKPALLVQLCSSHDFSQLMPIPPFFHSLSLKCESTPPTNPAPELTNEIHS